MSICIESAASHYGVDGADNESGRDRRDFGLEILFDHGESGPRLVLE